MLTSEDRRLNNKAIAILRLKIGLGISLVLAVIFSIGLVVLSAIVWKQESNLYEAKVVKQNKVGFCQTIHRLPDGSDFTLEIAALWGQQPEQWPGWKYARNFQDCKSNAYLYGNPYSTCYFARQQLLEYFECVDSPLSIGETLANQFSRYWPAILVGMVLISLLPIAALAFGRLLRSGAFIDQHRGWRRIQIALTGLVLTIGIIRAFLRLNNWRNTFPEDLGWTVLFAMMSWVGFLVVRRVMRWLQEGFEADNTHSPQAVTKSVPERGPVVVESQTDASRLTRATFWSRLWARAIAICIVSTCVSRVILNFQKLM